jgi:outer membrane protein
MRLGAPAAMWLALLPCASHALAQNAPVSPAHPWHSPAELRIEAGVKEIPNARVKIDSAKTYSLAELIDLAEAHNPATRVAWERARAQAAALGIARSELYPTLAAAALSQTSRSQILFGNTFVQQTVQDFQGALNLNYTVFDFGARSGRVDAASAQVLAANSAFNDTHRNVIHLVQQAYYRLLSSLGQEDAARASLANAQAVRQAAEDRLGHGLATLPDVLEARSATAQADYDLQAVLGAKMIARGDLAAAVGTSATAVIKVRPLNQVPTPDSIGVTIEQAINRALAQRPDLMQRVADVRSANARASEARAAYYPALSLNVSPAIASFYGVQPPFARQHTTGLVGALGVALQWPVLDGGARRNRLVQAGADVQAAEAQVDVTRIQIADEVWTAYASLTTAFRQRRAAVALMQAAGQSYDAALESYNLGLRSLLDVTAAQRTLAQARSADVVARTQVLTAFAALAFQTGDALQGDRARQRP